MRRSVLVILLAGLAAPCAPALAATVRINDRTGYLEYRAAPGEKNRVRITASADEPIRDHESLYVTVEDSVPIKGSSNCTRASSVGRRIVCDLDGYPSVRALVRLGDRDDRVRLMGDFNTARVDAGRGSDTVYGGTEEDLLLGGPGADDLNGGGGVDRVFAGGFGVSDSLTADHLRGGPGSDLLAGSAGPNRIVAGDGVDEVSAGAGADTVFARDGTVEQVHCGAGPDRAVTDGADYPLACERRGPYSDASPVPLEFSAADGERRASLLLGCREAHLALCAGTVQLELGGRVIGEELPFTGANRHRWVMVMDTTEPVPDFPGLRPDLVVRIRAHGASGAPTDDSYPVPTLLVGSPFLGVRR